MKNFSPEKNKEEEKEKEGENGRKRLLEQNAEINPKRIRPNFRPVHIELAGSLSDVICQEITKRLRQYRNRYSPIMRLSATLMAPAVSELELFGLKEEKEVIKDISEEDTNIVDNEEKEDQIMNNNSIRVQKKYKIEPLINSPNAAIVAEKKFTIVHRLHEGNAVEKLEEFMAYHFLPMALLHNCFSDFNTTKVPFILRHYVHEATRTASFLIADLTEQTAVIIDPNSDISTYEKDISNLKLKLVGIVLTHCFVDIAMGHAALLAKYPTAVIFCGNSWKENSISTNNNNNSNNKENYPMLSISSRLFLRCIPIPSFSLECLVVELYLDSTLLALFTGTVFGTDALPRLDFFNDFPEISNLNNISTNNNNNNNNNNNAETAEIVQKILKECIWDRYFDLKSNNNNNNNIQSLDHVIVFPSHGGYNNVTYQLDLYWAVHIGDLKRMKHSRKVLDTILDSNTFFNHIKERPLLPKTLLMSHVRKWNMHLIPSIFNKNKLQKINNEDLLLLSSSPNNISTNNIIPIVVDIRGNIEHEAVHLKGSVNIPMNFPATLYGVKKAELWLQCVLRPLQPIIIICESEEEIPIVKQRLSLISPGAPIEVFTAIELEAPSNLLLVNCEGEETHYRSQTKPLPTSIISKYLPHNLVWISNNSSSELSRIDNYQQLKYIEPTEETLVLDCRTPYEFKNGSHKSSVNIPLADLCQMTALDEDLSLLSLSNNNKSEDKLLGLDFYGPSLQLGPEFLNTLYENSLTCGIKCRPLCRGIKNIVVYCAGGYRSLIAASLLRRAFEAAAILIQVHDVAGGALQIMNQRPDLWTVKDRSIICIS